MIETRSMYEMSMMKTAELYHHMQDVEEYRKEVGRLLRIKYYSDGYQTATDDLTTVKDGFEIETEQEARDKIVEQAKDDIEVLRGMAMSGGGTSLPITSIVGDVAPRFVVNKEKRTVVTLLDFMHVDGICEYKGIAKCAPSDCFNSHIGKAIALRRALGLEVPDEYLNAPNPTEARVGDYVAAVAGGDRRIVVESDREIKIGLNCSLKSPRAMFGKVVDDSQTEDR